MEILFGMKWCVRLHGANGYQHSGCQKKNPLSQTRVRREKTKKWAEWQFVAVQWFEAAGRAVHATRCAVRPIHIFFVIVIIQTSLSSDHISSRRCRCENTRCNPAVLSHSHIIIINNHRPRVMFSVLWCYGIYGAHVSAYSDSAILRFALEATLNK